MNCYRIENIDTLIEVLASSFCTFSLYLYIIYTMDY